MHRLMWARVVLLAACVLLLLPFSSIAATCPSLASRLVTRSITITSPAQPNDEYTPAIIAPRPDGSSFLAWADKNSQLIRVAILTDQDALSKQLPDLEGVNVHDMVADANGAVLAIVANDPQIYNSTHCWSTATSGNYFCAKMDAVRIDNNGNVIWRTTLTNKIKAGVDGSLFIWWYGHTARIATDGSNYAIYYRTAGTFDNGDIHAGDTLKFVSSNGTIISGGWDWGCSHSWSVRTDYDAASKTWAFVCHGDAFPNGMKASRFAAANLKSASDLQWLQNTDPSLRALGGIEAAGNSFWISYYQTPSGGTRQLRLAKIPVSGAALVNDQAIAMATSLDGAYPFRPYMAPYGQSKSSLLLGWKSGGKLVLGVASATDGSILDGPVTTSLSIDNFQDIFYAPNGDAVWAFSPGTNTIQIQRVLSCDYESSAPTNPAPGESPLPSPSTASSIEPDPSPVLTSPSASPNPDRNSNAVSLDLHSLIFLVPAFIAFF